ncbi:ribonuclease Y [Candidatus Beckwithbacteria bacterium CG22_combo_CG10-13_8_21_14_all_01_47_9]|uniref:Ribonuclease Y n=1 Tax=Candidatus Beckwithbacteria bacterium CG22_combo_CG10-13_8_21_14_all_01_47_9 TaxID=1974496 RepID=A0A2H0E1I7_9BACT|nr:MAG: ribonuclease Y [Candidatus Beckwithbacteria bacterium CG22_combo_CG10-13_8_21_14_all_01_47_9]
MSFLGRFSNIMAGKTSVVPVKVKPVAPVIVAKVDETKARELIFKAEAEAQRILGGAQKTLMDIDRRLGLIDQRERTVSGQEHHWQQLLKEVEDTKQQQLTKLQAIAKLSQDEAKELILKTYQKRLSRDVAQLISDAEKQAKAQAEEKARDILVEAMRHGATEYVAEYTVSLVKVKDEDVKGRIIGREGRNIRTFEKVTGVEVDLDEEGVIRLSCFDPVRREIARVALEKLIADGRVQPVRIEEIVQQTKADINRIIHREGEQLCHSVKVFNLPAEISDVLGRFKYRFSYGQNMIQHTLEETRIGLKLAYEVGADPNIVRLGCLLHDIGKVIDEEEGTHVELGVEFLKKYRIPQAVIDCVAEHHEDKSFSSKESMLVYIADAISGSRPGARYEDHGEYIKRMDQLEAIAKGFDGVKEAFAMQAGREVRVMVNPDNLSDDQSVKLASDIRDKIQGEIKNFPGQIKITVIREKRAEAIAA